MLIQYVTHTVCEKNGTRTRVNVIRVGEEACGRSRTAEW